MKRFAELMYRSKLSLGITMGIVFAVTIFFFNGHFTIWSVLNATIQGILFGTIMSLFISRSNKYKYFIINIQAGKYDTQRRYRKLYRKGLLPESKSEYKEYDEYLTHVEKLYVSTRWAFIAGPILFGSMFMLTILVTQQYVLSIFFALVLTLYIINYFWMNRNVRKLKALRLKITAQQ